MSVCGQALGARGWDAKGQGEEDLHCHLVVTRSHRGSLLGSTQPSSHVGSSLEVFISAVDTPLFFFPVPFTFFSPRKGDVGSQNSTFRRNIFREEEVRILRRNV